MLGTISALGSRAYALLEGAQQGSVMGTTSRGVFIGLPGDWVVFLSTEVHRGPLTLNGAGSDSALSTLSVGAQLRFTPGKVILADVPLALDYHAAEIWQAPPVNGGILPPAQRQERCAAVSRLLAERQLDKPAAALRGLLATLAGIQEPRGIEEERIMRLADFLQGQQDRQALAKLGDAITGLLGWGEGLTPCGDDLALGFLLALQRWGGHLAMDEDTSAVSRVLVAQAYRRTTTLSANLIECAADGQADERLLLALDGLVTGAPDAATCARCLADWGSSSGASALAGMALALAFYGQYEFFSRQENQNDIAG